MRQSRILVPWARESVVKYVMACRRRRESVVKYVVPYRRRLESVVKYVGPYLRRRESVEKTWVPLVFAVKITVRRFPRNSSPGKKWLLQLKLLCGIAFFWPWAARGLSGSFENAIEYQKSVTVSFSRSLCCLEACKCRKIRRSLLSEMRKCCKIRRSLSSETRKCRKYVGPYRRRRESVAKYVGPYRRRREIVVKHVGPYRRRRESVVYVGP